MTLYNRPDNSVKKTQKIVIPKGMINPAETTVIEIPSNLHKKPIVIARRKDIYSTSEDSPLPDSSKDIQEPKRFVPDQHAGDAADLSNSKFSRWAQSKIETSESFFDLDETEAKEMSDLQHDLLAFQRARRKLLARTNKLTARDTSPCKTNRKNYSSYYRDV